jgi:hypothetical protein
MDLLTVVMHELGHVLGLPDLGGSSHNLMSETLPTGERHLFAVPGSPGVGHKRLVVMESAVSETAASLRLPEARDGWLTEFLNGYADPNDRIAIDLSDKGKEDPNFNPWKRYGKRARN